MNQKKRKRITDINELTKGFEKLVKEKGYAKDGKEKFDKALDKALKGEKKKGDQ